MHAAAGQGDAAVGKIIELADARHQPFGATGFIQKTGGEHGGQAVGVFHPIRAGKLIFPKRIIDIEADLTAVKHGDIILFAVGGVDIKQLRFQRLQQIAVAQTQAALEEQAAVDAENGRFARGIGGLLGARIFQIIGGKLPAQFRGQEHSLVTQRQTEIGRHVQTRTLYAVIIASKGDDFRLEAGMPFIFTFRKTRVEGQLGQTFIRCAAGEFLISLHLRIHIPVEGVIGKRSFLL